MTKKKKRRSKDNRVPVLTLLGLGAAVANPVQQAIDGDYEAAIAEAGARFTGYNFQSKVFDLKYAFMNCYLPIILGALGSKAMTKLGVNRAMKKIPMLGKYIKL